MTNWRGFAITLDSDIVANTAAVLTNKLSNGQWWSMMKMVMFRIHNAKLKALEDVLKQQMVNRFNLLCNKHDLARIKKHLKADLKVLDTAGISSLGIKVRCRIMPAHSQCRPRPICKQVEISLFGLALLGALNSSQANARLYLKGKSKM